MTPQERTELQRALELAWQVVAITEDSYIPSPHVKKIASALLSLAAERDELRDRNKNMLEALSQPMPPPHIPAYEDDCCSCRCKFQRDLQTLESRYSELEKAARELFAEPYVTLRAENPWDVADLVELTRRVNILWHTLDSLTQDVE